MVGDKGPILAFVKRWHGRQTPSTFPKVRWPSHLMMCHLLKYMAETIRGELFSQRLELDCKDQLNQLIDLHVQLVI